MTIYAEPRLLPCGDRALSVELADEIGRDVRRACSPSTI